MEYTIFTYWLNDVIAIIQDDETPPEFDELVNLWLSEGWKIVGTNAIYRPDVNDTQVAIHLMWEDKRDGR